MFQQGNGMRRRTSSVLPTAILILVLFGACLPAGAANIVVDIGGGWQASWDGDLYPTVDIISDGVVGDWLFIEKSAEFTQGPQSGIFPSIAIVFQQIDPNSTVTNIVINDEIVTNSTGVEWTDFHFDLLDGLDAQFNPAASAVSGGPLPIGFSIAPFTEAEFSPNLKRLDIWGGVVADGQAWFPGDGPSDGQLWIDVVSDPNDLTLFILKETPTPEPATMCLLVIGGLAMLRRRQRKA